MTAGPRVHNSNGRFYPRNGRLYVSSTNVLSAIIAKPQLIDWAASRQKKQDREAFYAILHDLDLPAQRKKALIDKYELAVGTDLAHAKIRDSAGDIGTQVHNAIESELLGKPLQMAEDHPAMGFLRSWRRWAEGVKIENVVTEETVYHDGFKYAGTMDFAGEIDGKFTVADWKTSKSIHRDNILQVASYALPLYNEHPGVIHGLILRLSRSGGDPEALWIPPDKMARAGGTFVAALAVWGWLNEDTAESRRGSGTLDDREAGGSELRV
jgi:hypothetical protein